MSKIIVVNAGSSSLKFQLFVMPEEKVLCSGNIEKIGLDNGIVTIKHDGQKKTFEQPIKDHGVAVSILLDLLISENIIKDLSEINGCGHRIVQGGAYFNGSVIVDEDVANKVDELAQLAPLHNKAHLTGYYAFKKALPGVGHVFTFDTAFHQTIKEDRFLFPIPYEYYLDYKVRKYGAHGTSHRYVSQRCIDLLGNPSHSKIIVCHIGNGASLSACKDGVCVDTSMGLSPLGGVMMGSRCGDIDPTVCYYLEEKLGLSAKEFNEILNKKSGYLGVSGVSSDARDVCDAANKGNYRAILTRKMHVNTVTNYIGSYFVELGGCDAICFTAGIGENDIDFRKLVCERLEEPLGVKIDLELNKVRGEEALISTPDSKIKVFVIPTNEELMIVRDTKELLGL